MSGADWRLKEQREKEQRALEKKQEEFRLQQLRDKNDQRMAAELSVNEFLTQIRTCVDDICTLEENIAVRKKDGEISSKIALKEISLEGDIERIKTYYQSQREEAQRILEVAKSNYEKRLIYLEKDENSALAKREIQMNELERKKEQKSIPPAVKKMMIELQSKKEMYPRLLKGWSFREIKFPEYCKFPPEDYTQHESYKQRKAVAERAIPENKKSEEKVDSEPKRAEPKIKSVLRGGDTPGLKTENNFEPRPELPELTFQPPAKSKPADPPAKLPEPPAKPTITLYQGIRKRKVANTQLQAQALNLFPTTHHQTAELSHSEWYELRMKQIQEQEERKEAEEAALRAKLSREEDEAEAEEIRMKRQAEEADKEWDNWS
jgi:hypothetical protein